MSHAMSYPLLTVVFTACSGCRPCYVGASQHTHTDVFDIYSVDTCVIGFMIFGHERPVRRYVDGTYEPYTPMVSHCELQKDMNLYACTVYRQYVCPDLLRSSCK